MSETKDICGNCGHFYITHGDEGEGCKIFVDLDASPQVPCPCTHTYESLVGEKDAWHPFEGGTGYETPCTRCGVSFSNHHGIGTPPDHLIFHDAKPEPSLQLLVIDMGDSCVVKVEKGEFKWTIAHTFNEDKSVLLTGRTFTELREAIEQKRVPRIESCGTTEPSYEIINIYGDGVGTIYQTAYDALSELAGKPLPIYKGGTWEDLLPRPELGIGWELPVGIWRYTR